MKWFLLALLFGCQLSAAEIDILGDHFSFTEGPAVDAQGTLHFSDLRTNKIYTRSDSGSIEVFRKNSGGANGLSFDATGNLIICEGTSGRLVSLSPTGVLTVLADGYNGVRFNRPNDLWIDPLGGIYFTDPCYGGAPDKQGGEHVYYLTPDRAKVLRVIDDFSRPNGVIGTPDGKTLYVADAGESKIWKYSIDEAGKLENKTLFAQVRSDGMTLDQEQNLYVTDDRVRVYNPEGDAIRTITTPVRPTNVTFSNDFKTLYITARTHLLAVRNDPDLLKTK